MNRKQIERVLDVLSLAWGPSDNEGFCFFPWIVRSEQIEGKGGFHTEAFYWPNDRQAIIEHLTAHQSDDVYWCPVLFDEEYRQVPFAHEEYCLWADLDESHPELIDERWRPSVAWETSPGRYQALWLLNDPQAEDLYGASFEDGENRQMTYAVEADPSGWDTTQLLRIPGWVNHKPEYRARGKAPSGTLMWQDGPRYDAADFNDLPPLPAGFKTIAFDEDLAAEIGDIDRKELAKRVGGSLSRRAKELLKAKHTDNEDRSKTLWYLIQSLAEADCTVAEIIAMVRPTVWNKFDGRADELRRLGSEAASAVRVQEEKSEADQLPQPQVWSEFMAEVQAPKWLIPGLFTRGSVGFIAGEPKTRKSWVALDLAFSVAMTYQGYDVQFLDHFRVANPGPVLYLMLEDAPYLAKKRGEKMWSAKTESRPGAMAIHTNGDVTWGGEPPHRPEPQVHMIGNCSLTLSEERGQLWLADVVGRGAGPDNTPYCLLVVDTLMRAAGNVDENRSYEVMSRLLAPLTRLARRHDLNVVVVNHFNKNTMTTRPGQRILGAQANHAWAEDSLYLFDEGKNTLKFESESKSAPATTHTFSMDSTGRTWAPRPATTHATARDLDLDGVERPKKAVGRPRMDRVLGAMQQLGPGVHTTEEIAAAAGMKLQNTRKQVKAARDRAEIEWVGRGWITK